MPWDVSDNVEIRVTDVPASLAPPPIAPGGNPAGDVVRVFGPGEVLILERKRGPGRTEAELEAVVDEAVVWMEAHHPRGGTVELRSYDGVTGECVQRAEMDFVES